MDPHQSLVGNAAAPKQVERAGRIEARRESVDMQDFRQLLESPQFRRYLWRLMGHCHTFESVFDGPGSKMSYNSGMQDIGHYILAEIERVRPTALIQMMEEAKLREEHHA